MFPSCFSSLQGCAPLLFFDRGTSPIAPLGPGAVVVTHTWVAEQARQHKPGVGGTLPDAAIGDNLFIRCHILATIHCAEFLCWFKGTIRIGSRRPGNIPG